MHTVGSRQAVRANKQIQEINKQNNSNWQATHNYKSLQEKYKQTEEMLCFFFLLIYFISWHKGHELLYI